MIDESKNYEMVEGKGIKFLGGNEDGYYPIQREAYEVIFVSVDNYRYRRCHYKMDEEQNMTPGLLELNKYRTFKEAESVMIREVQHRNHRKMCDDHRYPMEMAVRQTNSHDVEILREDQIIRAYVRKAPFTNE